MLMLPKHITLSQPTLSSVISIAIIAGCTALVWLCRTAGLSDANGAMLYLAAVAFIASRFGHGSAILATIVSVLSFPFFFHPPVFGLTAADTQYLVMLAVLLGIGLLISELTSRLKSQLSAAQRRERRTAQLHEMTLQLNEQVGMEGLIRLAGDYIRAALDCDLVIYSYDEGDLKVAFGDRALESADSDYKHIVTWAARYGTPTGIDTGHFSASSIYCAPMTGAETTLGVIAARHRDGTPIIDSDDRRMLATCANLLAISIERDRSRAEVHAAQVEVHTERLRNALLSSVSHDLRTPLATISVGASSVLQSDATQLDETQRENLQVVVDESARLSRQVDNLLEMAQVNSGTIIVRRDWHVFEELVGIAISQLKGELKPFVLDVQIPPDFPLLWVADDLIVKVFVNILENAARYCPNGSRIEIVGSYNEESVMLRILDNGLGLPRGIEDRIFERFVRGTTDIADGDRGIGLGLAICRSIVDLHDGRIHCRNRPQGGAEFELVLPLIADSLASGQGESASE